MLNKKTFSIRTLSAVLYAAIMLSGLLIPNPWAIIVLGIMLQYLCVREFFELAKSKFQNDYFPKWNILFALIVSIVLLAAIITGEVKLGLFLLTVPMILFFQLILYKRNTVAATLTTILAIVYIGLPIALLIDLRSFDVLLPIVILVLIWINDTMAYVVGSIIGKTPLTEISPKKTWEGTIGGIILTLLVGSVFGFTDYHQYRWFDWNILSVIVALFGTLGDLLESFIKRQVGVKDSGHILPGHGGALDRLDSLLAVLPFAYLYCYLVMIPSTIL